MALSTDSNRLLAALGHNELARLRRHLHDVSLEQRQVLFEPEARIDRIYFPHSGMISLVNLLENGASVETATIGHEGLVGIPLADHEVTSSGRAVVQVAGRASVIAIQALKEALRDSEALRTLFGCYSHAFLTQVLQSVACNAVHTVEKRMARWLLTAADRSPGRPIQLTHEILAEMLGVGRPTVTLAAQSFQAARTIDYRRGAVTVLDRQRLERTACECYGLVRRTYETLLPLTFSSTPRRPKAQPTPLRNR